MAYNELMQYSMNLKKEWKMTRNEELRISIMTLNMFARYAVDGVMTNEQFERHCQNFIAESGLELGDAEAYIELAIERADSYR